jgi:ribosomal protein L3 glutamine methyltransferase
MKDIASPLKNLIKAPENIASELNTVCDFVRYAVSRFTESGLVFGHGTGTALDEAAFIVLESLNLPPDSLQPYWNARLTMGERERLTALIEARIETRKPAPYLLNKAYLQGYSFYVDERVIVPRSFIAEILARDGGLAQIDNYGAEMDVLNLCTGSGCLAILAAHLFPNARIDAVDISSDALDVARRNVADHGLEARVRLHHGDLFAPLAGKAYDLIITNPPYVDRAGMESLPPEFRAEPALALAAGADGLDIVRRIMTHAPAFLKPGGGMICELGRCGPALENAYPGTPFLWLSTENSEGEVFWLGKDNFP